MPEKFALPDEWTNMTFPEFGVAAHASTLLESTPSYWDPDSECTIVYARPEVERELWADYIRGACHSYQTQGVGAALDVNALRRGDDTVLFATCVNDKGRVIGGIRAKGPYRSADECHAVQEWDGQPGQDAVRKMVADRVPFGVAEMKTAWATDDREQNRRLTTAIARTPLHAMNLLDIQFIVATAASYVLKRWLSSGGVLATKVPATPYPDVRYQTKLAWWDRLTFTNHADPKQVSTFFAEQRRMLARFDEAGDALVGAMR